MLSTLFVAWKRQGIVATSYIAQGRNPEKHLMHAVASHNYLVVEGDNIQHRVPVVVSPRNLPFCCLTGGEIASTFDNPGAVKLGRCKLIEEIMIGEDRLIHFSGTAMGEACTIVLRGASESPSSH
jgi:hypothetical protein